jgi:hypothetical protein
MGPVSIWGNGVTGLSNEMIQFIQVAAPVLVLWFVNMGFVGWLAGRKGREGGLWAFIAFFTGPIALVAILVAEKHDPIPESEAARLEAAAPSGVRLVSDSELELDVAGRLAWLKGEVSARINGRPSFKLSGSSEWHWSDGTPMSDEERAHLRDQVPRIGRHDGWILTLDARDQG